MKFITRKPIRLKKYNYAEAGWYFVTVCARNRRNIFGEYKSVGAALASARNNNIKLTKLGQIIETQWNDIPDCYHNVELDQYIVMPNHIHGILIIHNRAEASTAPTIPQIIRSFKSKCTVEYLKYIEQNRLNISGKIWQRSFYDHIIKNEPSLDAIRKYIFQNPENWEQDVENLLKTH